MYDCLVIGGGAAGLSCVLVLGSARDKEYAKNKKIGIIAHQRASHLNSALFYNVLGLGNGTKGSDILKDGIIQLKEQYPHVNIIEKEKVKTIAEEDNSYTITTNKGVYQARIIVVAVGYTDLMTIEGLNEFIEPHPRAKASKSRIWLRNTDHLVKKNLFVAGTLAGWRSQYAIACGSGAHVATDILTIWNGGEHTKVHDKL